MPPTPTSIPKPKAVTSFISNFSLEDRKISVGTKVTWVNQDEYEHTTTSGASGSPTDIWDSNSLNQGDSFSFTFTETGTFIYFCRIHTYMTGTITVTGP